MNKASLEPLGEGRFRVSGILDTGTATAVLKQSDAHFASAAQIEIDLAGVTESDSAGLALLIEWLRTARQRGQRIRFMNVPGQIRALAQISEVDELFCANAAEAAQ